MFRYPVKQLIVNSATSQVAVLKKDGSATYVNISSPSLATDGFYLQGFLAPVGFGSLITMPSGVKILAVAGSVGQVQISTWTANTVTGGNASSENFRIVYQDMRLSPTEYQNQPLEKHYQVSATLGSNPTAANTAAAVNAAINSDKNSPVTSSVSGAVVTLTGKLIGVTFQLYNTLANRYVPGLISGTFATTQASTLPINTYDTLKNIKWADNGQPDFDRNAEFFPVFGTTYKGYSFIVKSTSFNASQLVPSQEHPFVDTEFHIWIANGLTLQTTMDLVVANANSAT